MKHLRIREAAARRRTAAAAVAVAAAEVASAAGCRMAPHYVQTTFALLFDNVKDKLMSFFGLGGGGAGGGRGGVDVLIWLCGFRVFWR